MAAVFVAVAAAAARRHAAVVAATAVGLLPQCSVTASRDGGDFFLFSNDS